MDDQQQYPSIDSTSFPPSLTERPALPPPIPPPPSIPLSPASLQSQPQSQPQSHSSSSSQQPSSITPTPTLSSTPSSTTAASAPPADAFPSTSTTTTTPPTNNNISTSTSATLGSLGIHEQYVRSFVKRTAGWPKPDIVFLDASPLLADVRAFRHCIDSLVTRYADAGITHVAGIDARGFTFGSALAYALNCGFIMIRKAGKLPPASEEDDSYSLISEPYDMEYGQGKLQIAENLFDAGAVVSPRVILVDDLIATGGTAIAACNLLRVAGATVVEVAVAIELVSEALNGRKNLKQKGYIDLFSLLTF